MNWPLSSLTSQSLAWLFKPACLPLITRQEATYMPAPGRFGEKEEESAPRVLFKLGCFNFPSGLNRPPGLARHI